MMLTCYLKTTEMGKKTSGSLLGLHVMYLRRIYHFFVCNSENGSMTSKLLCQMLKHIDDCHVFDRTDEVLPFLLLDGLGIRFELPFLNYINDVGEEGHKWRVCIGCFKRVMVWVKMNLLQKKADC